MPKDCVPQLEDGYVRIANSILEALSATYMPMNAMSCVFVIFRKTYGYNRKESPIKLDEFVQRTGLLKSNVCRALKWLVDNNIVIRRDNGVGAIYRFNKYHKQWRTNLRDSIVISSDNAVIRRDNPIISSDNSVIRRDNSVIRRDNPTFIKDNIKDNNKDNTRTRAMSHGSKSLSDEITLKIYKLYNETINPIRKSAVRAKKNIAHHLKHYTPEDLRATITNYNKIKPDGPEYRKDPANFFGRTEPYFVDYLPGTFEAPREDDDDRFENLQ